LKAITGLQGEAGENTITGLSKKTSGFTVYPNPVADNIFVEFDLANESNVQIQVLNTAGQVVINEQKGRMDKGFQQAQLDVKNLTAGMYILKLAENDAVSTKKFVVRR
jgi:Secretion system C-terminal sorting domain